MKSEFKSEVRKQNRFWQVALCSSTSTSCLSYDLPPAAARLSHSASKIVRTIHCLSMMSSQPLRRNEAMHAMSFHICKSCMSKQCLEKFVECHALDFVYVDATPIL